MSKHILTINTGSATIKLSLFAQQNNEWIALYKAESDKLVKPLQLTISSSNHGTEKLDFPHGVSEDDFYSSAISLFLNCLNSQNTMHIIAVSHRVVHGGVHFSEPIIIDDDNIKILSSLIPLAPLHQPFNLQGIYEAQKHLPHCQHIACFDTAFHHSNPQINRYYAIPRHWEAEGVRRYGFHGLSYAYIQLQLEKLQLDIAHKKVIVAHLGQGASLCALDQGKSVLTSMGFTALDGLVMGTRSGNIDPGVLLYWMLEKKLSYEEISDILYKQSGLLGLSGISCDMRTLLNNKSAEAQLAVDIFVQRVCHYIGVLTAELQGLDGLIFTAGIGENAAIIREMISKKLQWLGVKLDLSANQSKELLISTNDSKVKVYRIPTNEEYMLTIYAEKLCLERRSL